MGKFEIAGGSIIGREHLRTGKNCQDGYAWKEAGGVTVAVVCDGCGSSDHSEVGSKMGAKIVVNSVLGFYLMHPGAFPYVAMKNPGLQAVQRSVLTTIQSAANQMAGSFSENISDYFLFTILGLILDENDGKAYIFGCGDGTFYVNDVATRIPSPNNAPGYLSYNLIETNAGQTNLGMGWMGDVASVKSMLIATDGVDELASSFDRSIAGKEEKIGGISQFWEKDGFFKNPFSIGHRLALINRSVSKVDWEKKSMSDAHGPLRDDTTLVAIRRKKL